MNVFEINLKNVIRNIEQIKSSLKPKCKFCAVVKANAYGLGAKRIAHAAQRHVDYFAVSRIEELAELRKAGTKKPVLLLCHVLPKEVEKALELDGEIQVDSFSQIDYISEIATRLSRVAKLHLKFNTGMNRFGFVVEEAEAVKHAITKNKNLCVKGVFTHFFHATDAEITRRQNARFEKLKPIFEGAIFHAAATESCNNPDFQHDMVRVGIGAYIGKHPAVSIESQIVAIQKIEEGSHVGYSSLFVSDNSKTIAIFQMGYADGLPRAMANGGKILVQGDYCPIVAVCMDSAFADISNIPTAGVGDKVKVLGRQNKNAIKIVEIAEICDTISYEILTGITARTKRKYVFR